MENYHTFGAVKNLQKDIPASIALFLVALPLCIGIAHACGLPVIQGLIAGMVGGVVIGLASGSKVSASGPAAGLVVIVESALHDISQNSLANHNSVPLLEIFALVVVLAGLFQLVLGVVKLGKLADYIPVSVIKGMLAAIGLLLILKQLPHLVGWDADDFGDEEFLQLDGQTTFSEISIAFEHLTPLALFIGFCGLAIQFMWDHPRLKKIAWTRIFPSSLLVVLIGVGLNQLSLRYLPTEAIESSHLVQLPKNLASTQFDFGIGISSFGLLGNILIWILAIKIGVVASIESLLSIEASDKIDPLKRVSPPNRELLAQGLGNVVSGVLGGMPLTAVVVRSSANINAGNATQWSAVFHGIWLALAVLFIPSVISLIPNAALAAILIFMGYKLAKPSLFTDEWKKGKMSFVPFIVTVLAILFTDLLIGIILGMVVAFFFIIKSNFHRSVTLVKIDSNYLVRFQQQSSFMNKSLLKSVLHGIPQNADVILDFTHCNFIDQDILDVVEDYQIRATSNEIRIEYSFANLEQKRKLLGSRESMLFNSIL
jgi:MFS superfamily sulfate permease-like transporter